MPKSHVYDKVMSNLQEIKARGGPVIAVVCEGDDNACTLADDVIEVPTVEEFLQPIVTVIPLQLLAYHIAVARGCDVDKPHRPTVGDVNSEQQLPVFDKKDAVCLEPLICLRFLHFHHNAQYNRCNRYIMTK